MRPIPIHTTVRGVAMALLMTGLGYSGDAQTARPVHLNLIWHQHQPLYVDPALDGLTGPWVRAHATKDYYDMAAMLRQYPELHCTFNLTSSLLVQLQEYYVARLSPFVDFRQNKINAARFLRKWKGKTDPWIDLMLTPSSKFTSAEKDRIYRDPWNCFGISDVMIGLFPEYRALREKLPRGKRAPDNLYSEQELRELKFWFFCAWFDPDFLQGPVTLQDGSVCDLSEFVRRGEDGLYRLRRAVTEQDCQRLVVEATRVMANVVPVHTALRLDVGRGKGQCDIITTPYYHPILPLIFDSDLARVCQPADTLPSRFAYPEDASAQVRKAVAFFTGTFGAPPDGMWPGEGSVAQEVLPLFRQNGIRWIASDVKVLQRSKPDGMPNTTPYRFPAGDGSIALVFRDTDLSDRIGFTYQGMDAEVAAEDFVHSLLVRAPGDGAPDVLVTVILDGENAWEWYRSGDDGKGFLHALYRKLSALQREGRIITTTVSEYLDGNPKRGIFPHPIETLPGMEWLWPGSWINANFDTWIGEDEENRAWDLLGKVRKDLAATGIPAPDPAAPEPPAGTKPWYAFKAWEAMYAAEGSDWFWWYGNDQTAPGSEVPLDRGFRTHLKNVYLFARKAGAKVAIPRLDPILGSGGRGGAAKQKNTNAGGTMAR